MPYPEIPQAHLESVKITPTKERIELRISIKNSNNKFVMTVPLRNKRGVKLTTDLWHIISHLVSTNQWINLVFLKKEIKKVTTYQDKQNVADELKVKVSNTIKEQVITPVPLPTRYRAITTNTQNGGKTIEVLKVTA